MQIPKDEIVMGLTEAFPLLEGSHLHGFLEGSHVIFLGWLA